MQRWAVFPKTVAQDNHSSSRLDGNKIFGYTGPQLVVVFLFKIVAILIFTLWSIMFQTDK